jgi:TatD DNase family protein
MLIDTHAHIQFQGFNADRDAVIARCKEKGMILNLVGTQKDTSRLAVELAEQYEWMYASIATHPVHLHPTHIDEEESHFLSREESFDSEYYDTLAQSKKVIAVGEAGLDLYHLPPDKSVADVLLKQTEVFLEHADFALKHDLPLAIHCRNAHDQMIAILRDKIVTQKQNVRGVIHCFTSGWEHAKKYIELGFYLGFTGVVTYPPKKLDPGPQEALLEVMRRIPLDRIVVETDCPYLAPQKYRGERSEPWMVEEVVKKFAEIKQISYTEMETQIEQNTFRLFDRIVRS